METKIIVVGIGPGSADYILPAAQKMIAAAHYLVGGKRALADFAGPHQSTQVIDRDIPAVLRFVSDALQNHDVVVMVSGDPGFHSFLTRLRTVFGAERLTVIAASWIDASSSMHNGIGSMNCAQGLRPNSSRR